MSQISDILYEANPWWGGETKLEYKERLIYRQLKKFLNTKMILAFTGLRRVGKTTLMLKIIKDRINGGMDPKDILFFSFDEKKDIEIRDVIKEYERLLNKDMRSGKHLLILDEIQKLDGWEDKLKWIYDVYSNNTKILISGSESLFIRKKSRESLAGRMFEFKINPLSFREFLEFKGQKTDTPEFYKRELGRLLNEYIRIQGFPELVGVSDQTLIKKYITEGIAEKIIYKDIPEIFEVRNTDSLASILKILMEEPGQLIEHLKLSKELGISRYTVSKYLEYLENAFLVRKLYNYSRNARKSERSLRKYYPSIISTELTFKTDDLYRSKVFEWLLVNQADAQFFWRDERGNEVDMVVKEGPLPIEIKYGRVEQEGVMSFMNKFKVNSAQIITNDIESVSRVGSKTINIIPAYKFMLRQMPQL